MTYNEVLQQLEDYGTAQNRKIYTNHGCDIDMFGVSMANQKQLLKFIKNDKQLGRQLFFSDNMDAIYLSHWIVEPSQLTIEDIEDRILFSNYYLLIEYAIPSIVAKEFAFAMTCIHRWINHEEPRFRQAAYGVYSLLVSMYPDDNFDLNELSQMLEYIPTVIHEEENRVRYTMNQFVIAVGAGVKELFDVAMDAANKLGTVDVNMGRTACKVPFAPSYLTKIKNRNRVGYKRK